eukprot:5854045-Pyramimonas_sp.AAC.1
MDQTGPSGTAPDHPRGQPDRGRLGGKTRPLQEPNAATESPRGTGERGRRRWDSAWCTTCTGRTTRQRTQWPRTQWRSAVPCAWGWQRRYHGSRLG